jgi:hypothetical protein
MSMLDFIPCADVTLTLTYYWDLFPGKTVETHEIIELTLLLQYSTEVEQASVIA